MSSTLNLDYQFVSIFFSQDRECTHLVCLRMLLEHFARVNAPFSDHLQQFFQGRPLHLSPPTSLNRKATVLSALVISCHQCKQAANKGSEGNGGKQSQESLKNKTESADLLVRGLPDPLTFSRSDEGMWARCCAKCGSSFHLRTKIYSESKKLKNNKTGFLFGVRMYFLKPSVLKYFILHAYAAVTCNATSPLCIFLCFTLTLGSAFPLPLHPPHLLPLFSSD